MVWAMCMCNVGVMMALVVPSMAKVYAWSFPWTHVWEPCDKVHYGGYEEFVGVVKLGGWVSYVLV